MLQVRRSNQQQILLCEDSVNAGRKRAESTRTRDTALALQTAPTLPTARSNIDIEQVGVPFKCQKNQIISTLEGNLVKLNNGKVSIAYNYLFSLK
jgi:hypothetical protein